MKCSNDYKGVHYRQFLGHGVTKIKTWPVFSVEGATVFFVEKHTFSSLGIMTSTTVAIFREIC